MARLGAPDQQEMADEGYEFDYVMVFKVWGDDEVLQPYQQTHSIRDVVHRLHKGGLQTFLHFSSSKDEVFCNIRCPLSRMHAEAERVHRKLLETMIVQHGPDHAATAIIDSQFAVWLSQQGLHARLLRYLGGGHQGGDAFHILQVGVGLGSQQGLHARLMPFVSGQHQGGVAVDGLQV